MVICAAFGCSSRSGRDKVGFFAFPSDKNYRKIWIDRIGRGSSSGSKNNAYVPNNNSKLCSKHFDESQFSLSDSFLQRIGFEGKFKRQLKPDALPTLFLNTYEPQTRQRRPSADQIQRKKRKLEIVTEIDNTVQHSDDRELAEKGSTCIDPAEVDSQDMMMATPLNPVSSLETLALVASNASSLPVIDSYHAQCQTPVWVKPSKETQTNTKLVTNGTQTDWENDVQNEAKTVRLSIPKSNESAFDSFFSDIGEDSVREESLETDETWSPSGEDSDIEESVQDDEFENPDRKFIVFESELDKLLKICPKCNSDVQIEKSVTGALLRCQLQCDICCETTTWSSQPCSGTMAVGHLEMAAAIMFSGSGPSKFLRALQFAGIQCFRTTTFFNIQKCYLLPAICDVWESKQADLLQAAREKGIPLKLGGDARCCSPGHTAKYGSYSMMDLDAGKIIDIQLVQSNEVKNSYAMELEGLQRSLAFLMEENELPISHLITDRHSSVKKYMRERHSDITHWFDVWHVAKGVYKKLEAAGRKKGCEKVLAWSRSVSNHLYWCAASSNGDGELVQQKWLSILNHVCSIHEGHGDRFPECEHGNLEDRVWMKKGFKPHAELTKVVQSNLLVKDIKNLSPAQQTSSLEAFHKVVCSFAPKSTHYQNAQMEARLFLAALHFNENSGRAQGVTKNGTPMFSISYPRGRKGEPVVKEVKTEQTFDYVKELLNEVLLRREHQSTYREANERRQWVDKARPVPLAQSTPKRNASKTELIRAHCSRFNKQ